MRQMAANHENRWLNGGAGRSYNRPSFLNTSETADHEHQK